MGGFAFGRSAFALIHAYHARGIEMSRTDDFTLEDWYLLVFLHAPLEAAGAELRFLYRHLLATVRLLIPEDE